MNLPSINVIFKAAADSTVQRIKKGVVAVILKDAQANGSYVLSGEKSIPAELGTANQSYLKRAFIGYDTRPRQVLLYVLPAEEPNLAKATAWLATQDFDYLVGPPGLTTDEAGELTTWVKEEREQRCSIAKAVLPEHAADHEGIVNFSAADIQTGGETLKAADYCSRIAGILVGTPMTMSCTYAPLNEVTDIKRLTDEEAEAAVEAGKLILLHDGTKVKLGLGVNSLQSLREGQNETLKKIKIVEVRDLIQLNLRRACQDGWIGRHSASYDDKCLLISAVRDYLVSLETEGILQSGSTVGIDTDSVAAYLEERGTDISEMDEQALKEADTGSTVFLACSIHILDAIESIQIVVNH